MSVKSIVVKGKLTSEITCNIWDPYTSYIKSGIWAISLEKCVVQFDEDCKNYFSFCVKTNLVDQTSQDKQGRVNQLNTCLGVFSCKGNKTDEVLVHNVNQTWFQITVPASELRVFVENPFTEKQLSKKITLAFYFLYKRIQ